MSPPWLVRAACALDLVLAAAVLVAVPVLSAGWLAGLVASGLAATLGCVAHQVRRGRFEGWLFQLALLTFLPLRVAWAYRPFGALVSCTVLYLWIDPDVLAWFRIRSGDPARRPPAPVVVAAFTAAIEVAWIALLPDRLFQGYREGLFAPLLIEGVKAPFAGALVVGAVATLFGWRLAWYAVPALLTPVLMSAAPAGWALLLAPAWFAAPVRAWHGLPARPSRLAALAVAPPLLGLAAYGGLPVGLCERDGYPITLVRWSDSPLTQRLDNFTEEDATDVERMKIHCALEEVFVAERAHKDACWLARGRGARPERCPLDGRMRARLGARALPEHRFEPQEAPGRPPWACTTCEFYERKGAPAP